MVIIKLLGGFTMKKIYGMTIAAFVAISICSDNSFTYAEEPYSWVWYTDSEAITSIEQYI